MPTLEYDLDEAIASLNHWFQILKRTVPDKKLVTYKILGGIPPMLQHITNLFSDRSEKRTNSLILGTLFVLLNATYIRGMAHPADEAKWLLLQVFAPALAFYCMLTAMLSRGKIVMKITYFQMFLMMLFAWAATSGSWALDRVNFSSSLLDMSSIIIVMVFFSAALRNPDQRIPVFFLEFFSTLVATVGILQYFGWAGDYFAQVSKPASFFVNKNFAAPIVAASLPLLTLTLLIAPSGRKKLLLLIAFHLNFAYLLISISKSSWIGYFGCMSIFTTAIFNIDTYQKHFGKGFLIKNLALMASGIVLSMLLAYIHDHGPFPIRDRELLPQAWVALSLAVFTAVCPLLTAGLVYLWRRGAARHRLLPHTVLLAIALCGIVTFGLTRPTPILEQLNSLMTAKQAYPYTHTPVTSSWTSRIPIWVNSLMIVRDHPILGVGLGSFDAVYPLYHKALLPDILYSATMWAGGTHNDPLQLWAELGLIGLTLAFLCFLLISRYYHTLFKTAAPATALMLTGCYLGGLSLLFESFFNPVFHQPSSLLLLAFFIGAIHSALYHVDVPAKTFIFRREIAARQGLIYLTAPAFLFFLMVVVSAPWAFRRYQASVLHKEAYRYLAANKEDEIYFKMRQALDNWPYSNRLLCETAAESFLYLQRHFNDENLQQAREYNHRVLQTLPYHYNTNLIRIALLKHVPGGRSEIKTYAPLLLKVVPDKNRKEALREING